MATGLDGKLSAFRFNQDLFALYYRHLLADKGAAVPQMLEKLMAAAERLTDKPTGEFGLVSRGLRNANVVLHGHALLGFRARSASRFATSSAPRMWPPSSSVKEALQPVLDKSSAELDDQNGSRMSPTSVPQRGVCTAVSWPLPP